MEKKNLPTLDELFGVVDKRIIHRIGDIFYHLLERHLKTKNSNTLTSSEIDEVIKGIITNTDQIKERLEETLETFKQLSTDQQERAVRYSYEENSPSYILNFKVLQLATEVLLDDILTTEIFLNEIGGDLDLSQNLEDD